MKRWAMVVLFGAWVVWVGRPTENADPVPWPTLTLPVSGFDTWKECLTAAKGPENFVPSVDSRHLVGRPRWPGTDGSHWVLSRRFRNATSI